ncbi:hypothetical protein [Cellvibrio fibrivorans]|uniref:Uncharacterized protein n=1 Tax=Cellvibrio fibrivorans TaxID=126350 RepID=A0ABU1V1R7_9GAMM|nr:hypothetical protein [Cellvibrio fibrivorans]MDR7091397.1 hypothetical protein [Cellvibrio fibrivorans]
MLGKLLNILGKLFLCVLALLLVYVLGVLLINLRDKPPSATVIEFQQSWDNRKPVDSADNGYLYFLGFDVAKDADPKFVGEERVQWTKEAILPATEESIRFPQAYNDFQKQLPKEIVQLMDLCSQITATCINNIEKQRYSIIQWSKNDTWILDRYRQLIAHKAWLELMKTDIRLPLPSYGEVMKVQRLAFISALAIMHPDESKNIAGLLDDDLRFWRSVLKNTDTLIGKMIAVAAIKNNFLWTNFFLLKLDNSIRPAAIPAALIIPFTDEELSMRRCLIGEWFLSESLVYPLDGSGIDNFTGRLLLAFAYQKQDTLNKRAESLNSIVLELDVPLTNFEATLELYKQKAYPEKTATHYFRHPYNVVGQILSEVAPPTMYTEYVVRTKDLEAFRRGLLLIIEQMKPTSPEAVRHVSPYKTKPFALNQEQQSVTVFGLGNDARAQQTYYY